jgi:sulfane dehydrogenase subunit SoxC
MQIRHHLAQPAGADQAWQGPLVITGLAWSGHGKITRVDVSKDGGMNWQTARSPSQGEDQGADPLLSRFDWDGEEMLLQSRAMDETGYVQPTKDQLREVRGLNSIYHNNCIQTWHVSPASRTIRRCRSRLGTGRKHP